MKLIGFAIHDTAANAYLPPFWLPAKDIALRTFKDCVNDPENQHAFARNPKDYTLFVIGEFQDRTGELTPCTPEAVANGLSLLNPKSPQIDDLQNYQHQASIPMRTQTDESLDRTLANQDNGAEK